MSSFRKLPEPVFIGSLGLNNRILKMDCALGLYPWQDGHTQQEAIDTYEDLAKGGVVLVTVGAAPFGVPPSRGYLMSADRFFYPHSTPCRGHKEAQLYRLGTKPFHTGPALPPFLHSEKLEPVASPSLRKEEIPLPFIFPSEGFK